MKKVFLIGAILLVTTAIIFAIPSIPVPVQHIENYVENVTKQEPYIVKEKQEASVPHVFHLFKYRWEFADNDRVKFFGFLVLPSDLLCQKCTCDFADPVGHVQVGTTNYICVPDGAIIRVSWTVDENDRGKTFNDMNCSPHYGFISNISNNQSYLIDKYAWEGELEIPVNKVVMPYLRYGYDNPSCNITPPVNNTVEIIWYTTEIVDKEVTKYRDVQMQVEKQRTVTDYQKVSVWQRIFAK
jgi:hypothetical protein